MSSSHSNDFDDPEFSALIRTAENAIVSGVQPEMISQGSSGSYFVKNIDNVRQGWGWEC